jgi:hypothetical protein
MGERGGQSERTDRPSATLSGLRDRPLQGRIDDEVFIAAEGCQAPADEGPRARAECRKALEVGQ